MNLESEYKKEIGKQAYDKVLEKYSLGYVDWLEEKLKEQLKTNIMETINYKGKGEHSVNELELIIEQQAEELHLIKSGQQQLAIQSVNQHRELLQKIESVKNFEWGINPVDNENRMCELIKLL